MGLHASQCFRHCASGNLVSFVEYCACAGDQMLGGSHETYWSHCCSDVEKAWSTTFTYVCDATCANCCLAKWSAVQMMQRVAGTGKRLRHGAAMKSGERPTSHCPRRIIGTARSGNAPLPGRQADWERPQYAFLLVMSGFRNSRQATRGLSGTSLRA